VPLPPRTLRYRSVAQLNAAVVRWARTLDPEITLIIGVPRSGLLVASLLGLHTYRPVMDLSGFLAGASPWSGFRVSGNQKHAKILIVDDSVNSGRELERVRSAVAAMPGSEEFTFVYGAAYATRSSRGLVDTYAELIPHPRIFEWNMLHHELLSNACMDIDGVLCADPLPHENDDGERYRRFIRDTQVIYRPTTRVEALVTSRLEKYRPETEDWLETNKIEYGRLIMLDLPSAEERRRLQAHAKHKAQAYLSSGAQVFIESSAVEGHEIYELTGRPVFITDTREFLGAGADPGFQEPLFRRVSDWIRQI
jgi:uncharacterized HAD superfamily protein